MHARNIVLVPIVHQAIRFDNCSFVMHVRFMILHEHHRTREEKNVWSLGAKRDRHLQRSVRPVNNRS